MFADDIDRSRFPLTTRIWGILLGSLILAMIVAGLISPRTFPFTAPFILLGFAASAYVNGLSLTFRKSAHYGTLTVAAFLVFALLSASWAERPLAALTPVLMATVCCVACGFMVRVILKETRPNIVHIAEGVWIGLLVGLIYLLIEVLSQQAIKLTLYNALGVRPGVLRPPAFFTWTGERLVAISPDDLTRNMAVIAPLLWMALLSMRGAAPRSFSLVAGGFLFALAAAAVFLSEHETSKFALAGGTAAFLLARRSPMWGHRVLRLSWVVACLAIIPISLLLHRFNLHNTPWVQQTAQHRIIIWNHTAEQALASPIFGRGAGTMYQMLDPEPLRKADEAWTPRVPHAHNIYLQTWLELGAVGAALLTLIGLAVLERIRGLGRHVAPYAQATFASTSLVAASSYGMWQTWFMVMFALIAVAAAIGVRANVRAKLIPGSGPVWVPSD